MFHVEILFYPLITIKPFYELISCGKHFSENWCHLLTSFDYPSLNLTLLCCFLQLYNIVFSISLGLSQQQIQESRVSPEGTVYIGAHLRL